MFLAVTHNEVETARETKSVACGRNAGEKTVCAAARWQKGQERYPLCVGCGLGQVCKADPEAKEKPVEAV